MVRGPKGERRPDDPAQAAVLAVRITTGEISEELDAVATKKDPDAVALGRRGGKKGGKARAEKLSSERRREIALAAARSRWNGDKQ
jgi:hypothetical protein